MQFTPEELLLAKVACNDDLLYFTRLFYKILRGSKFIRNWHHDKISDELEKVNDYKTIFLNINIPPRFSKTELAAINFIARGLAKNPTANYLYITSSDELRSETSVRIRDIVTSPEFKFMYGVELKKDQNSKNLWRTQHGGGLKTATIFGQITGFGAGQMIEHDQDLEDYIREFEGCIILDDINKIDDVENKTANNEKTNRIIFNTILSRKNSKDTPIINIQQRSGEDDATAVLMDHYKDTDKVVSLVLPVIIDDKPLWSWKLDMKDIYDLENSDKTAHIFHSQYMQDPKPLKGLLFPKDSLNWYEEKELRVDQIESINAVIDVADEGTDKLAMPIGRNIGERCFITDVLFTSSGTEITIHQCADMINTHKVQMTTVESNSAGSTVGKQIRLHTKRPVGIKFTKGNKESKILSWSWFIKKYMWFRSDYEEGSEYHKFIQEILSYSKEGKNKHDDAPDSITMLAMHLTKNLPNIYQ